MFDCATGFSENPGVTSPRAMAIDLVARSSASLRVIASRLGGDAVLALICVLCDMIIDPTVDPLHWPIDEAIALLRHYVSNAPISKGALTAASATLRPCGPYRTRQ